MKIFCKKCKREAKSYRNHRSLCKHCLILKSIERVRLIKIKAVEYKGGECEKCGYNACMGSLHFHHLDQHEKSEGIASLIKKYYDLDKIRNELDKCILLCANCHGEEHGNRDSFLFTEEELLNGPRRGRRRGIVNEITKSCSYCNEEFKVNCKRKKRKFCSLRCSSLSQRKTEWPSKEELEKMLFVDKMTRVKISKLFGVSDVTIRSWCINYGIIEQI